MDLEIKKLFWLRLPPGKDPDTRLVPLTLPVELYQEGFVDVYRISMERWIQVFDFFPLKENFYRLTQKDLARLSPFLYQGPLKDPFDPHKLKLGPRKLSWLRELFIKVFQFETDIKMVHWEELIRGEIQKNFVRAGHFQVTRASMDYLQRLLEEHASPLRRLEIWIQKGCPVPEKEEPETVQKPTPPPTPIRDEFGTGETESRKMKEVEKLYYQQGQKPQVNDEETLDILDEIADSSEEDDELA